MSSLAKDAEHFSGGISRYKIDLARVDNFFDHLCWAIYYDRYGQPFDESNHSISHIYPTLHTDDPDELRVRYFLSGMIEEFQKNYANMISRYEAAKVAESVYSCQIIDPISSNGSITIIHTFYGLFEAVSMLSRKWERSDV